MPRHHEGIGNKFGKNILHDKIFVGGGAEKFLMAIGGKVRNNIEVSKELSQMSTDDVRGSIEQS